MDYQLIIDDYIGDWGFSSRYVRNILSNLQGQPVSVKISSYGGDLFQALDILQQFIDHGDITVYITGGTASAATVVAMGAKKIVMSKYAAFLVHKCANFIDLYGTYNADQINNLIEDLKANKAENDKIDSILASIYADRCHRKVSEIAEILKAGAWMTAEEAKNWGFIDEISDSLGDTKFNFSPDIARKLNALGLPTQGLATDGRQSPAPDDIINHTTHDMPDYNFKSVESVLKLDSITPDKDGYVSVTAEDFSKISNHIAGLETSVADKDAALKEANKKVDDLTAQVENLKQLPGDETGKVDDTDKTEKSDLSAHSLFNSIKSAL